MEIEMSDQKMNLMLSEAVLALRSTRRIDCSGGSMTPDTLKALAAELPDIAAEAGLQGHSLECLMKAKAVLEQLAGADAGCPVRAWWLLDQGCRAPDDCEDFERVELASDLPAAELERFKRGGRATALITMPDHLAALTAQSGEWVALIGLLRELLASELTEKPCFEAGKDAQDAWADRRAKARNNASAAIAAYEARRGGAV